MDAGSGGVYKYSYYNRRGAALRMSRDTLGGWMFTSIPTTIEEMHLFECLGILAGMKSLERSGLNSSGVPLLNEDQSFIKGTGMD